MVGQIIQTGLSQALVYALDRNINIAKELGDELATQVETLTNDRSDLDKQAENLFFSGRLHHQSQLRGSQVNLIIFRPNLLN